MGIAVSAFNGLFAPLQGLLIWLSSSSARPRALPAAARVAPVFVAPHATPMRATAKNVGCSRAQRPLRVVRVMDKPGNQVASGTGRMVISGRMADVCAELDRLAAMEARASVRH